jgi:translation initiation factor 1
MAGQSSTPPGTGGFGMLLRATGLRASERVEPPAPGALPAPAPEPPKVGKRAVLSIEKKGRGGKTVTFVAGLGETDADRATFAQSLRKALGTGAVVEEERILVQGDQRERLRKVLAELGVSDIRG